MITSLFLILSFSFQALAQSAQQPTQIQQPSQGRTIIYPRHAPMHISGNCVFKDVTLPMTEEARNLLEKKGFTFDIEASKGLTLSIGCQRYTHDLTGRVYYPEYAQCSAVVLDADRNIIFEAESEHLRNDDNSSENVVEAFIKQLPVCSYYFGNIPS